MNKRLITIIGVSAGILTGVLATLLITRDEGTSPPPKISGDVSFADTPEVERLDDLPSDESNSRLSWLEGAAYEDCYYGTNPNNIYYVQQYMLRVLDSGEYTPEEEDVIRDGCAKGSRASFETFW